MAGATYFKINNFNLGLYRIFYNCLSTLGSVGSVGPIRLTKGSGTTESDVVDLKLYLP